MLKEMVREAAKRLANVLSTQQVIGDLDTAPSWPCSHPSFITSSGYRHYVCCSEQQPAGPYTWADTDFVLFVTARPTSGNTVAWALECESDQNKRPISGHANFNPAQIPRGVPNAADVEFDLAVRTAMHEILHALGFSGSKFAQFRRPGTNTVATEQEIFHDFSSVQLGGKTIRKLITPNVAAQTRAHFGCNDPWEKPGLELEDAGGGGTAGSHWEKRIMGDELMTGTKSKSMPLSTLTLAVMQDSGWYFVDISVAEQLPWGKEKGCSFIQESCGSAWPTPEYFCMEISGQGCTVDMKSRALCDLVPGGSSKPTMYRYFDDPTWSGTNSLMDFCPTFRAFSDGECVNSNNQERTFRGEKLGVNTATYTSRCFHGNVMQSNVGVQGSQTGLCFKSKCTNSLIEVVLASPSGQEYSTTCEAEGGLVDVAQFTNGEFSGTFMCPASSKLCSGNPCDNIACENGGSCNPSTGVCMCPQGIYGDLCQFRQCPLGQGRPGCSGKADCDPQRGVCVVSSGDFQGEDGCDPGFKGADCSIAGCPPIEAGMTECYGNGACINAQCVCNMTHTGIACQFEACPNFPGPTGSACGSGQGTPRGECDGSQGVCECATNIQIQTDGEADPILSNYFSGAACQIEHSGVRKIASLNYTDAVLNKLAGDLPGHTVNLKRKQYTYVDFDVASVEQSINISAVAFNGSGLDGDGRFTLFAAFASAGLQSELPSRRSHTFRSKWLPIGLDGSQLFGQVVELQPGSQGFSQQGRVVVAILAQADMQVNITVSKDPCSAENCANGDCIGGRCVCKLFDLQENLSNNPQAKLKWTGEKCDVPVCPSDCSGNGQCTSSPDVSRGNFLVPYCQCSALYAKEPRSVGYACNTLPASIADSSANVASVWGSSLQITLTANFSSVSRVSSKGEQVAFKGTDTDWTLTASWTGVEVDSVQGETPTATHTIAVLKLEDVLTVLGLQTPQSPVMLTVSVHTNAAEGAQPMLLAAAGEQPKLSSSGGLGEFDKQAWQNGQSEHRIHRELFPKLQATTVVALHNSRTATARLRANITVELSTGCPQAFNGCNSRGMCLGVRCVCDEGWEGAACAVRFQPMTLAANTATATSSSIQPGDFEYFYIQLPLTHVREVEVTAQLISGQASRTRLRVTAAFAAQHSGRGDGLSILSETGAINFFDFSRRSSKHVMVMERSQPGTQKRLLVAVENTGAAQAPITVALSVTFRRVSTLTSTEQCSGQGTIVRNAATDENSCACKFGWAPISRCASPAIQSATALQLAIQQVKHACSICSKTFELSQYGVRIFRLSKPLQKGSSLRLVASMLASSAVNVEQSSTPGSSALITRRRLQPNATDERLAPSVMVATRLPRSIGDFDLIQAPDAFFSNISLSSLPSPNGQYWVALYANAPGNFSLQASRVLSPPEPIPNDYFVEDVAAFMTGTTSGQMMLALGTILLLLGICMCVAARCMPKCCLKAQLQLDEEASRNSKQIAMRQSSLRNLQIQQLTPTPKTDMYAQGMRPLTGTAKRLQRVMSANKKKYNPWGADGPSVGASAHNRHQTHAQMNVSHACVVTMAAASVPKAPAARHIVSADKYHTIPEQPAKHSAPAAGRQSISMMLSQPSMRDVSHQPSLNSRVNSTGLNIAAAVSASSIEATPQAKVKKAKKAKKSSRKGRVYGRNRS